MFEWKDVKADVVISRLSHLLRRLDWYNALQILSRSVKEPVLFMTESCYNGILAHTGSSRKELGGLLVGMLHSIPYPVSHRYPFVSILMDAIPSEKFESTAVSLRMEAEVWTMAHSHVNGDKTIVGWYHSHPNIGAFFSGTDRSTQSAFFNNPYSLGVVVDPVHNEWMSYSGPDSEKIEPGFTLIDDALFFERT